MYILSILISISYLVLCCCCYTVAGIWAHRPCRFAKWSQPAQQFAPRAEACQCALQKFTSSFRRPMFPTPSKSTKKHATGWVNAAYVRKHGFQSKIVDFHSEWMNRFWIGRWFLFAPQTRIHLKEDLQPASSQNCSRLKLEPSFFQLFYESCIVL